MKFIKIVKIIAFLTLPNQAVNVYIVAGQSNALGQGTYANTSDSQEYRLASNSSIQVAKAVSNIIPINQAIAGGTTYSYNTYSNNSFSNSGMGSGWDTTYGVEIGLGESLTSQGVEDIYIIKYAVGGAGLAENFSKTATGSPLYSDFINTLSTHISTAETIGGNDFNLAGMFWLQGEADAANNAYTAAYQSNFSSFIADVRADLGQAGMPVAFVPLNDQATLSANGSVAQYQSNVSQINSDITALAATDSNLYIAPSPSGYSIYDTVHYTGDAYLQIGNQLGTVFPIPEPSSVMLIGLGGITLLTRRNRSDK